MRVAVYHNNNDIRIEERERPGIGPGELLLRIEASGICGSDVMEWYRAKRAPLVLGHEVATPSTYLITASGSLKFAPLGSRQFGSIVWLASISSQFMAVMESAHWNPAIDAVVHM